MHLINLRAAQGRASLVAVKSLAERDRRRQPRFPQSLEVLVRLLPPVASNQTSAPPLQGRLQNVNAGGIGLLTEQRLPVGAVVRCDLVVTEDLVPLPILMLVRWGKERCGNPESYISGLQFLL